MGDTNYSTLIDDIGNLVISFVSGGIRKKNQEIVVSKKDNVLLVPASRFKVIPLDSISDVVLDTIVAQLPASGENLTVSVIDSAGKAYLLGAMPPREADSIKRSLIHYLFTGQSRPVVYLTDKVKILKFSTREAYFELDWRRQTNAVGFYLMFFIFVPLIAIFAILGIVSPFFLIPAGVVALVAGPIVTIVGVLYFRGLLMRKRVFVSLEGRSVTLENYSVKQERVTSSKTLPIDAIKDVAMRTRVQYSQYGTTASFTTRLELENGGHERLITMDTFLSARRFGMLLALLVVKTKKNIQESAENADNVLTYDSITMRDAEKEKIEDIAENMVDKYFSESRKQLQSERGENNRNQ